MARDTTSGYHEGASGLIVAVPEAESVVGYLTVADSQEPQVLDMADASVASLLPITAGVDSVQLMFYVGDRWREEHSFLLGQSRPRLEAP